MEVWVYGGMSVWWYGCMVYGGMMVGVYRVWVYGGTATDVWTKGYCMLPLKDSGA